MQQQAASKVLHVKILYTETLAEQKMALSVTSEPGTYREEGEKKPQFSILLQKSDQQCQFTCMDAGNGVIIKSGILCGALRQDVAFFYY